MDKRMARAIGCLVGVALVLGACGDDDEPGVAVAEPDGPVTDDEGDPEAGDAEPADSDACPMTFLPSVEEVEAALGFGVGDPADLGTFDELGSCAWLADDGETMVIYELALTTTDCTDREPSAGATPLPGLGRNAEWDFQEGSGMTGGNYGTLYVCYAFDEEVTLSMDTPLAEAEVRSGLEQLAPLALQHLDARD